MEEAGSVLAIQALGPHKTTLPQADRSLVVETTPRQQRRLGLAQVDSVQAAQPLARQSLRRDSVRSLRAPVGLELEQLPLREDLEDLEAPTTRRAQGLAAMLLVEVSTCGTGWEDEQLARTREVFRADIAAHLEPKKTTE